MTTRIQKVLAHLGLGSRRKCEEMVLQGRVSLDGEPVQIGQSLEADAVARWRVDGILVGGLPEKKYILLNKPQGFVTTVSDPQGRPTVMDLLPEEFMVGEGRVYPVGRLDRETLGALLFTNDGQMAHQLLHPSSGVEKEYHAQVEGRVTREVLDLLRRGPVLDDGPTQPPKSVAGQGKLVCMIIKEGRKRQVRRMLSAVGLKCLRLERVRFASLDLSGLAPGEFRDLGAHELRALKKLCSDYSDKSAAHE